jgi:hypothetical protein
VRHEGRVHGWRARGAVVLVAAVAGVVSYDHALAVVRANGESGAVSLLYPATIDGLVYSASMAMLDAARRGVPAPRLARWLLALGIGATLAANVASGLRFGPVGALVAAWPALAVVGSYELLMLVIRTPAVSTSAVAVPEPASSVPGAAVDGAAVPPDAASAARVALERSIETGQPLSQRELARRFGIPRSRAAAIAKEVTAASVA